MGCPECGRGFHWECELGCQLCHIGQEEKLRELKNTSTSPNYHSGRSQDGAPIKDPENVRDRLSTGRKRAAVDYPIFEHRPCEWQGKKNCGGGTPVVGCMDGKQRDRHHGPIKDPLENTPGNVHRICSPCHHHWHAVNDPIYNEYEWAKTKHDPQPATELELVANKVFWESKR